MRLSPYHSLKLSCRLGRGSGTVVQDVRLVILAAAQRSRVLLGYIPRRTEVVLIFLV